ncbi:MAG: AAA family ATPase [Chitinophagaceae bacterium]|nr:AAA family ATPase [Chitinophagaceae bacterium]
MSNHIDHIEITNFKSIRHAKIDGCKRINVFIGYPNVGKSAILEAMSALSYLQEGFKEDYNKQCRLNYSYELFYNADVKKPVEIKTDEENVLNFKYISEAEIELDISSSVGLIGGFSTSFKTVKFRNGQTFSSSSGHNGTQKIDKAVKKYVFKNNFNDRKTSGLNLDHPFGENLVDVIHLNRELRKEVTDLFKRYDLEFSIDPSTNAIKGIKRSEDLPILIPFYQMADTLQRLIFHKAAIMSNENAVLLFEEPEAHMFPPYIRMFTKDIVFDKGRNNQYFIATHSPHVLSDFLEDAREELAIHLVGYLGGETTIKTLTNDEVKEVYEYGVDLFFNIESYLG